MVDAEQELKELTDSARALEEAKQRRDQAIRAAKKAGYSYREIGDATGISFQRVAQILAGSRV